jgi:hypothetical protein
VTFGNRILRRVFEPRTVKFAVEWRKLRNVEVRNLYIFPLVINVTKLSGLRLTAHVARTRRL